MHYYFYLCDVFRLIQSGQWSGSVHGCNSVVLHSQPAQETPSFIAPGHYCPYDQGVLGLNQLTLDFLLDLLRLTLRSHVNEEGPRAALHLCGGIKVFALVPLLSLIDDL